MRSITLCFVLSSLLVLGLSAQEEYTFDLSEIEKKAFQFGGYLEFRPVLFGMDRDSGLYKLKFYDLEEGKTIAGYIYLRYRDITVDRVVAEYPDIFVGKSKIYSNGSSAVYR